MTKIDKRALALIRLERALKDALADLGVIVDADGELTRLRAEVGRLKALLGRCKGPVHDAEFYTDRTGLPEESALWHKLLADIDAALAEGGGQ